MTRARTWTGAKIQQLCEMKDAGLSWDEISERLGVPKYGCRSRWNRLRLHGKPIAPEPDRPPATGDHNLHLRLILEALRKARAA